jgi:hypothetical protein
VLFDSASKLRNFLFSIAIGGLLVASNSLTMLGGQDRLVSPSGLNTELGAASAISLIIIWSLWFPKWSFFKRMLFYPVLGVLAVALIGSGGRFANVTAVLCLIIGALLCRKLFKDVAVVAGLSLLALPFIWIPQASYDYLASLAHPPDAMGTRSDLMALGIKMFSEHPFFRCGYSRLPVSFSQPTHLQLPA